MNRTHLLFVEDDPDDTLFLQRACKKAAVPEPLTFLENGKRAVEFLESKLQSVAGDGESFLIFLDLNMPEMNGFDFLRWIRGHQTNPQIPVLILSTSDNPSDITRAYQLGANAYLVKPGAGAELNEMMSAAYAFWVRYNRAAPR